MLYDLEKLSKETLVEIMQVMKKIRKVSEIKGKRTFCFFIDDHESDDDYQIRIIRNLANDNYLKLTKFWSLTLAVKSLSYIKIAVNDSFFDFYNKLENKINTINNKKEINQVVSKEYKKWKDITLSFVGEQQIKITHKGIDKIITFEEFGFADTRSKQSQQIKSKKS